MEKRAIYSTVNSHDNSRLIKEEEREKKRRKEKKKRNKWKEEEKKRKVTRDLYKKWRMKLEEGWNRGGVETKNGKKEGRAI